MRQILPLFYFPSTVCWVDDDQLFLDAVNVSLKKKYNFLSFNQPVEALRFFSAYDSPLAKTNFTRVIENDILDTNHNLPVDINIQSITNLAFSSKMQDEISVLIVDYNMPNMNGLELCEQLRNFPFKKILLTGDPSHPKVVEAFNNGLIHKFIEKGPNNIEILEKYINELKIQFFYEKSKNLLAHIEASGLSPLSDQSFINFFNSWCDLHQVEEFYLLNRQGSFLVKDKNLSLSYFVIMSERESNQFVNLHDDAFDKVGHLLRNVSNGKSIPFFGIQKESWEFDFDEWEKHFYPSEMIQGREKYYWSVVDSPTHFATKESLNT